MAKVCVTSLTACNSCIFLQCKPLEMSHNFTQESSTMHNVLPATAYNTRSYCTSGVSPFIAIFLVLM